MKTSFKHKLKRFLINYRLLPIFLPLYEKLIYLSPYYRKERKENQQRLVNFYSQFIKPNDLCFDVGAYRGSRTDIFLKLGAKVVAVEPQPKCISYLKNKFAKEKKFRLVEKGLSDKKGNLTLFICEEADGLSTFYDRWEEVFPGYKWNRKEIVPVTTLDDLIREFGIPVFCKIDVEGYEIAVLKGLSQPISYLSFEFTKKTPDKTKICLEHLKSLGYQRFNFHFGEPGELFYQNWVKAEEVIKEIESSGSDILGGDIYAKL